MSVQTLQRQAIGSSRCERPVRQWLQHYEFAATLGGQRKRGLGREVAWPGGRLDAWRSIPGQPERGCVRRRSEEVPQGHFRNKVRVLLVRENSPPPLVVVFCLVVWLFCAPALLLDYLLGMGFLSEVFSLISLINNNRDFSSCKRGTAKGFSAACFSLLVLWSLLTLGSGL